MARIVSAKYYHTCNFIVYSICLIGLIWQVEQISELFFKFDTVKDINILKPSEMDLRSNLFFLCFRNHELIEPNKYNNLTGKNYANIKWTSLRDIPVNIISQVTRPADEIFRTKNRLRSEFLSWLNYCFKFTGHHPITITNDSLRTVTEFVSLVGHKDYPLDPSIAVEVQFTKNVPKGFWVKSKSYHIVKLTPPYKDQCFSYPSIGKVNQREAVADCMSNETSLWIDKDLSKEKYNSSNKLHSDEYEESDLDECWRIFSKSDCDVLFHLTQIRMKDTKYFNESYIDFDLNDDVSILAYSQPRIDTISYITYILGAMGSWLGFNFIGINPVPHLLVMSDNQNKISSSDLTGIKNRRISLLEQQWNQKYRDLEKRMNTS